MVKFNYIQNIKYWQEVFWILNMCFFILLHLFFVLDGKWRHQQSMRITVLLRTELVRYLEKKYIARSFHMEFFMWNVREGSKILYVKLMWSDLDMKTEFVYLLFQNDFFFFKFIKKSSSTNCVSVLNQAWCCFDSVSSGYSTASLLPQGLSKVSTLN